MKKSLEVMAVVLAALLCAFCMVVLGEEQASELVIPGTRTAVTDLFADLSWDFSVDRGEGSGLLTLDWESKGPPAIRITSFAMKSTKPHHRDSAGAYYLRLGLSAYQFENEAVALQAIDSFKEWARHTMPDGMMCKGAVYRAQKGPWVYVLDVGCQFSRANYELLVANLEAALLEVEAEGGRALQCYCGGESVEHSLE